MTEEQTRQSFGHYLNFMRLEAGLDLEYISEETKISKHTLQAIEEEDHEKLPEPVYVMGFIRTFADMVGADGHWAVSSYARSRSEYFELKQSDSDCAAGGRSCWPRFFLGAAFVIVVAITAYFAYSYFKKNFETEVSAERSSISRNDAHRGNTGMPVRSAGEGASEKTGAAIAMKAPRGPADDGIVKSASPEAATVSVKKKLRNMS